MPAVPRMLVAAGLGTLGLTWLAGVAHAAGGEGRTRARLTYAGGADIAGCPSERELKDAVAARLGYDPFEAGSSDDAGGREVAVHVRRRGTGLVGSLELRGPRPGTRELASPRGDCRELLDALAVAIAIGIDPASLTRVSTDPPPSPSPPVSDGAVVAVSTSSRPSSPETPRAEGKGRGEAVDVRFGAGPLAVFGELPATAAGLFVTASIRLRWFEPMLEGFATLPVSLATPDGTLSASLLAVSVLPCGHASAFFGCLGLATGGLRGEGKEIASPRSGTELYVAVAARAGVELPLSNLLWVRGYVEAVAPMTRITLQLASEDVWRMPSVGARVGLGAGVRF